MNCPGCGYESRDRLETCKRCGAPMAAGTAAAAVGAQCLLFEAEHHAPGHSVPGRRLRRITRGNRAETTGDLPELIDDDTLEVGESDLERALTAASGFVADRDAVSFRIDDDLPGPAFALQDPEERLPAGAEPIIDRADEVPQRYWAPEVAGLGRRAAALLVDHVLLLATLGIFLLGAALALRLNGLERELFLSAAGLRASALPFALLGAGLSLAFCVYFHRSRGRTPGKALFGIEVRTGAGGSLSWGRALLRWLGAVLGVACAGAGVCWVLIEPRRRSWADLISGTVVARTQRERARELSHR